MIGGKEGNSSDSDTLASFLRERVGLGLAIASQEPLSAKFRASVVL